MDAGIAAVAGAVVGVTGTVGAAWVTGRATRWQTREQLKGAERQQRLERRQEVYAELLTAAHAFEAASDRIRIALMSLHSDGQDPPRPDVGAVRDNALQDLRSLTDVGRGVNAKVSAVQIKGPMEVWPAAVGVRLACAETQDYLWQWLDAVDEGTGTSRFMDQGEQLRASTRVGSAVWEFAKVAMKAVDAHL